MTKVPRNVHEQIKLLLHERVLTQGINLIQIVVENPPPQFLRPWVGVRPCLRNCLSQSKVDSHLTVPEKRLSFWGS